MIRFNIGGEYLDLPEDFSLSLTKRNALFEFDELSCDRSVSFDVPATPTNNKIFSLAKLPEIYGKGMRQKYKAQMEGSFAASTGYLYITGYGSNKYTCVFVFGDLLGIKDFDNSKFGSLLLSQYIIGGVQDANVTPSPLVGYIKYHNDAELETFNVIRPSVDIGQLLTLINSQNILKIEGLESNILRLIRNSKFAYKYDRVAERLINQQPSRTDMGLSTAGNVIVTTTMVTEDERDQEGEGQYVETTAFSLNPNVVTRITFPDDTPENLCLCYPIFEGGSGIRYTHIGFLGTRRFARPTTSGGDVVYTGAPLAGQTVELNLSNGIFMLMTGDGLQYNPSASNIDFYEFDFSLQPDYNILVRISTDSFPMGLDARLPAVAGLMDLSLSDLLKMYSAVTGKLIGITNNGSIKFINAMNLTYLTPVVIEKKKITRTFADFAQLNTIQFKESDNVLKEERINRTYAIDNENIADKKNILTLAAIEGGQYDTDGLVVVRGVTQKDGEYMYETPDDVLTEANGYAYLSRTSLNKSDILESLCDASTTLEVTVYMKLFEYLALDSEKGIYIDGLRYVWTEAQYSKDVVTLKLSKISA